MAQYDGYVRINTEITDDAAIKKLQTLANSLNRRLMALEKQRGKVEELEASYTRLSEAGTEFVNAMKSGADDTTIDEMKAPIDDMLKKMGVSKDQITYFWEQIAGGMQLEDTDVFKGMRESIESARTAEHGLEANVENTRAAFEAQKEASNGVAPTIRKASSAIEKFNKRIGRMAKTALVFYAFRRGFIYIRQTITAMSGLSTITGVFTDFNSKMQQAYAKSAELQQALASLRGALYSAFVPISQTVIPMLVSLANWLARIISYISAFFAALNGKRLSDNADAAQSLANSVAGVGGAAQKASKQLAAFDKLNTLTEDAGGGGGTAEPVSFDAEIDEGKANKLTELGERVRAMFERLSASVAYLRDTWDNASLGEKIGLFAIRLVTLIGSLALFVGWPAAIIAAIVALGVFLYKNWDEIKAWWETNVSPRIDRWKEGIKGFFDDVHAASEEARQKMAANAQKFKDKFTEVKDHIKAIIDKIRGLLKGDIDFPHVNIPHIKLSYEPADSSVAKFFGITAIPKLSVEWYAKGGFPDVGSLFVAGESGAELVGSFGGHNNAVINEAQLVQAFQSATAEQVTLLRQQNAILQGILEKCGVLTFSPSAAAGKVFSQSIGMYNRAMG